MIDLQHIIQSKRELLGRETYSRTPINYSEGMSEDQKDRYIQYLAEQHQEDELTKKAMQLVLEDFVTRQKELKEQMASLMSEQSAIKAELVEERNKRKLANARRSPFRRSLIMRTRNVLVREGSG